MTDQYDPEAPAIRGIRDEARQHINEANWAPPPPIVEYMESVPALVIKPGDRVLVFVPAGTNRQTVDTMKDQLTKRVPEVAWTFLAGAVAVMRIPGDSDD